MARWSRENDFDREFGVASRHFKVPVSILKALTAIESSFNPDAYLEEPGGDGSRGLMQIRMSTAKGEGYAGRPEGLFIPAVNLYYAPSFFARLAWHTVPMITLASGRPEVDWLGAVSAYNGGYRPHLGFGARVRVATRICLRKDPKTGECIKWFTAQPGEFGNQPYVDKFRTAWRYFGGGERPLGAGKGAAVALLVAGLGWALLKARGALNW